jgi:hypothetical protein
MASFSSNDRDPAVRIPINRCVYCGATRYREKDDRRLGDEHVIPESLGGNLILERAACESCERMVNVFEQPILKSVLYAPRVHLGIRRKKRRRGEDTLTVDATVGGKDVKISLPIRRMPLMLFFMTMDSPGLLIGRPANLPSMNAVWVKAFTEGGPRMPAGLQGMASPALDTHEFMQFLAKIAHCYAVSALGDELIPLLPDIILADPASSPNFNLIGGYGNSHTGDPTANLHELDLSWQSSYGVEYAIVRIRMFAKLGAPTYRVVVGQRPVRQVNGDMLLRLCRTTPVLAKPGPRLSDTQIGR